MDATGAKGDEPKVLLPELKYLMDFPGRVQGMAWFLSTLGLVKQQTIKGTQRGRWEWFSRIMKAFPT